MHYALRIVVVFQIDQILKLFDLYYWNEKYPHFTVDANTDVDKVRSSICSLSAWRL